MPSAPPAPTPGVILLRNGEVLEGGVTLIGDQFVLSLPRGELRLHKADVELCCATLQEVCQRKMAAVSPTDVDEHLRLAQWCLKQKLLDEAARQLQIVAALQPDHPLLELFRQRLEFLARPPEPQKASTSTAIRVSSDELDRLIRGLPEGTMEAFAQRVQPLLVNHCATAGCHGPSSTSKYQLIRVTSATTNSRRSTQRNLLATLQWINHDAPAASPMLTVPVRPHGPAQAAIFTDRESGQYLRLVQWVYQATNHPRAELNPPTVAGQEPFGEPPSQPAATEQPNRPVRAGNRLHANSAAAADESAETRPIRASGIYRAKLAAMQAQREAAGATPAGDKPTGPSDAGPSAKAAPAANGTDPFDPEVFNRQFSKAAH
jgi:hypothetical protein